MSNITEKLMRWFKNYKKDFLIYFGYLFILITLITLAVVFQKTEPYSVYAINIGFVQIAWYAIFILSGIILGGIMAYFEFKRLGWDTNKLLDGILIIAPLSIIGARLYYVLFDPMGPPASIIDVIAVWEGGLAIHGAIIVATIGLIIFARKKKLNVWALADIIALGLLMGQIAGRWGNFMNAEAHGPATTNSLLINILPNFISKQMAVSHPWVEGAAIYHPTFLYESLANLLGLTILLIIRRVRLLKEGDTLGLYLIWYGLVRGILIEPIRTDQLDKIFGVPVNILLSLVLFVGGGLLLLILKRIYRKDENYYYDLSKENLEIND